MIVKEWLSTISFREFRTFIFNGGCWIAPSIQMKLDEYEDLFDNLKTTDISTNIKGKLSRIMLGGITVNLSGEEEQCNTIAVLPIEEIASLKVEKSILNSKEKTMDTLAFLLYEMTYQGKYINPSERNHFIKKEKVKNSLAPKKNLLDRIADDLYISYSNLVGLSLTNIISYIVFIWVIGFNLKSFVWASLIGILIFVILYTVGSILFKYQSSKFKINYKRNIERHLSEHPEDKTFLNTYEVDSIFYKFLF